MVSINEGTQHRLKILSMYIYMYNRYPGKGTPNPSSSGIWLRVTKGDRVQRG